MTTDTGTGKQPSAVYIPFKTLMTSTEVLAQGLPKKLDGSVFPTFAGSMRSWTLSAYQFLGFIDKDGNVQPLLTRWVEADAESRKGIMRELITNKYADVVMLAHDKGTPAQMRAEIEKLGVSGTTAHRAQRFFLDAAAFAGIDVPPAWKKLPPVTTTARKKRRGTTGRVQVEEEEDLDDGGGVTFNYPPVLEQALIRGLVEALPEPGSEWADAEQQQWLGLAKSIFGMVYRQPTRQLAPVSEGNSGGAES